MPFFFFQAEDGIRDLTVTGLQTCALPILIAWNDIGLPEMNTQTWTASSAMVVAMYYRIYFQVGMANEFLRQTTDDRLTARGVGSALRTQIQQYRAEARFLRALSYWHGIDLFGNI